MAALEDAIDRKGRSPPVSLTVAQSVRVVSLKDWREQFAVRYGKEDDGDKSEAAIKKAFDRAKIQLLGSDVVVISSPWVWIP